MTIASTVDRVNYVGAGTTGPFSFSFRVATLADLLVTTRDLNGIETTLVAPFDFTVTGLGASIGGTINLTIALAAGWTLTIRRATTMTQGVSLRNQGPYQAATVEDALDQSCIRDQTLANEITGSVHLPETIDPTVFDTTLPTTLAAGNAIVVNATGNGLAMGALSAATLSAWNAAQNQKLDVFTSAHGDFTAGTTTELTLASAPGGVQNVSVLRRTSGADVAELTDEYSVSGTTLTFVSAIPTGTTRVEVRYFLTYQINTADAANVTYAPASGAGTTVQARLRSLDAVVAPLPNRFDMLYVKDFGVVGDGSTDDTVAMQAALDAGAAQKRVVSGGNLAIKITGPLTMAGPGLVFNQCSFGAPGDPGISATGSGYVALLTTGFISALVVCIYGTGNAVSAFRFNNPQQSTIHHIRAFGFAGYGARLELAWDCDFYSVSVEQCVDPAENYSFAMVFAGETCNQTNIHHLQVEHCGGRVIYVDPNTLCCSIKDIHSEGADPIAGVDTWVLSGAGCLYEMCRTSPDGGVASDATLHLSGENNTYIDLRAEGSGAVVQAEANTGVSINLIGCNVGTLKLTLGQEGLVNVYGGTAVLVEADPGFRIESMHILTLSCGFTANPPDPTLERFLNCTIGALISSSTLSAATFTHCDILEGGDLLEGHTVLDQSTVTCASTLAGRGAVTLRDSTVNANVLMASGASLFASGQTRIVGTLGQTTDCSSLIGPMVYATGTVTGLGIPTKQPNANANVGGVWQRGQIHTNLAPVAGGTPGWVCTTAGGNGVFIWKPMASLGA